MPRATGTRSSAANHRARCRRTTSQCPTRAGPCGSTMPRRGCDSRRPGHHPFHPAPPDARVAAAGLPSVTRCTAWCTPSCTPSSAHHPPRSGTAAARAR
jgi:hypothetical protein